MIKDPTPTAMETGSKKGLYRPQLSDRALEASYLGSFCRISFIRILEYWMGVHMHSKVFRVLAWNRESST